MAKTPKNPIKDQFHKIVAQKMQKGQSGHQAIADTYAKAFPGSTIYHSPLLSTKERKTNPLKGIKAKPIR